MIRIDTSRLRLDMASRQLEAALGQYAETASKKCEAEAKANYPWSRERTGNAANSIQGSGGWQGDNLIVMVSGNMSYSVYLELAMEKRFAILKPTIDKLAPSILKGYQGVVRG